MLHHFIIMSNDDDDDDDRPLSKIHIYQLNKDELFKIFKKI